MIIFDPEFTEVIYLDTECYVPIEDRGRSSGSLVVNPWKSRHSLLGGVFVRAFPLKGSAIEMEPIWSWKLGSEKDAIKRIHDFFRASWKMIEHRTPDHPDLILVGTGISRFDIPMLFAKSSMNGIDSNEALYDMYFKTKMVDLDIAGIPLFDRTPAPVLYPKKVTQLMSRFGIAASKVSGKSVWELYDNQAFEDIEKRTAGEVEAIMKIASKILPMRRT